MFSTLSARILMYVLALASTLIQAQKCQKTCSPTAKDILGPKYIENATTTTIGGRICEDVQESKNRIIIRGRVLSSDDCETPIPSTLEIWQANENGVYSEEGDESMACRRILKTNAVGHYVFSTVMPGHYQINHGEAARAAHIHIMVRPDDQDKYGDLVTQMYFRSDEDAREKDACEVCHAMDETLIVDLLDAPEYNNTKWGEWRIYLTPKQ